MGLPIDIGKHIKIYTNYLQDVDDDVLSSDLEYSPLGEKYRNQVSQIILISGF